MSEAQESKAEATAAPSATAGGAFDELARNVRTAGYGSVALGAVQIGLSIDAVIRGLAAASVSPLAPGVYAMLMAIVLFRTASAIESAARSEGRDRALADALNGFFVDNVRYITLTLALCAIGFLIAHFH